MSIRDQIRAHAKPVVAPLEFNGLKVFVRALSGAGRATYTKLASNTKNGEVISPQKVVSLGLCEENGDLIYSPENESDLAELADLDGAFLEAVSLKLFEISGLTKGASEEAEKNLDASPSDDSGSGSR